MHGSQAVVESSISAFLIVTIDDAVLYSMLQHPKVRVALEPLGTRPRKDIKRIERENEEEDDINAYEIKHGVDLDGDGDMGITGDTNLENEKAINAIEKEFNVDLDGDGDVGRRGQFVRMTYDEKIAALEKRMSEMDRPPPCELIQNLGENTGTPDWRQVQCARDYDACGMNRPFQSMHD